MMVRLQVLGATWLQSPATCGRGGCELAPSGAVSVTLCVLMDSGFSPPGGAVTVYVIGTEERLPFDPVSGMLAL